MAGAGMRAPRRIGRREPVDLLLKPFRRFARFEAAGGVLLLAATVIAMVWANSGAASSYAALWDGTRLTIGFGESPLSKPLVLWINDLLMAVFFLLVGLEIKRELVVGELASPRRAAVPIIAAVGGMVVPALFYAAVNAGHESLRGWGVPMATDIAFALGVLALLGPRVPASLRVFLASLAIIDDLGALLVIAMFYTETIAVSYLGMAAGCLAILIVMNAIGARRALPYALVGLVLWYFLLKSGIHATIAGVLLAATVPARSRVDAREFLAESRLMLDEFERAGEHDEDIITNIEQQGAVQAVETYCEQVETPLQRLEYKLLPWVAFAIVPVFALANAGVPLAAGGGAAGVLSSPVTWGIGLGLVLGKPIGIAVAAWLAVRLGLGTLPAGVTWMHIVGAGCLAGIGFTMALFIAGLAFPDPDMLATAKAAVLGASAIAGLIGAAILWKVGGRSAGQSAAARDARPA